MHLRFDELSRPQRELLGVWLPGAVVVKDHSWGLVGATVLEVTHEGNHYIVKAGDANDHHMEREIRVHKEWLTPLTSIRRTPLFYRADEDVKLLVTYYLPGELVVGTVSERSPDTYRQAGMLLARFHGQLTVLDDGFEERANKKTLKWIDTPHRIGVDVVAKLRDRISSWPTPSTIVVPTHGDWQPRNWLVHEGEVSIIDFGRSELRPAMTDFVRLAAQQFHFDPALEEAFLDGYGDDPRDHASWQRHQIRAAIGTAAWAFEVGDADFESQGHRMIADALADNSD
jgi:tRNA A-37 threonylcarbamoyl transferase component Bud32